MLPNFAKVNWTDGSFEVSGARASQKKLGQLRDAFYDREAWSQMDSETIVYRVWWWEPVPAGTEGGLFWGTTEIAPGKVGNEYYMTQGHWHSIRNRAEFYGTVSGYGRLLLRDEPGRTWIEEMTPGSLHYIAGSVAHRTINTGDEPLRFVACWPSDAGHDYNVANGKGFGARVVEEDGRPVLKQNVE